MTMQRVARTLGWIVWLAATAAHPGSFCERLPFDEENPPGFAGRYDIVGRDAMTGAPYTGTLRVLTVEGKPYRLTRTIDDRTRDGDAWVEACGPDRFAVLRVRYAASPEDGAAALDLSCYLRFDGDNYTRASCTSFDGNGLEAWYQDRGTGEAP